MRFEKKFPVMYFRLSDCGSTIHEYYEVFLSSIPHRSTHFNMYEANEN
jgi:hypothetical protein